MHILTGIEADEALGFFDKTAEEAKNSICLRAQCGAVIVRNGEILGAGHNSPPMENPALRTCLNEYNILAGFRHDRTCCIHAEQRAIVDGLKKGRLMTGARIYFVGIEKDGTKMKATDLKCTVCSRAVLDAGISEFALYREEGVAVYDAVEFDRLSYEFKTPRVANS